MLRRLVSALISLVLAVLFRYSLIRSGATVSVETLPPQSVIVDLLSSSVLGANSYFRSSSFTEHFNPTNSTPPFFQVFNPDFLSILGDAPSIRAIASKQGFAFAHEAPIWLPNTDEVFFTSRAGGPLSMSDMYHNNQVSKIDLIEVAVAIKASGDAISDVEVAVTTLDLPDSIQMTNGGTGPFHGSLLLVNSGRASLPSTLALVDPTNPKNVTIILDNFFGRQFNSLNDAKIHPKSGKIFFTDVSYGFLNRFRSKPMMPYQVYCFDPKTGVVRVVADGFDRPNGIAFTRDGKTAYISDTGALGVSLGNNQTEPTTIYAFDVDPTTQTFLNRRVFAYADAGIPDGIQLDTKGNVYAGCGDGVHVWNPEGILLGKIFLGTTAPNMIFAGKGRLIIMAETKIFYAEIAAEGFDLSFPRQAQHGSVYNFLMDRLLSLFF